MPSTRHIMTISSAILAVAGAVCLFLPVELLSTLNIRSTSALIVQLLGALYLGAAAANWTARGSMIGGIYARPLALANFVHFVVGAIVLMKGAATTSFDALFVGIAFVYVLFASAFVLLLFGRTPKTPTSAQTKNE